MTFGHVAGAVHEILTGLGGTARVWRVDRMASAVIPGSDRLNPQFAQMAKHYGVDVAVCPAHRPQRKGVVEAAIKFIGGRWWRTAKTGSMFEAQQSLDTFTVNISDRRARHGSTVGELGSSEPLRRIPVLAFPAEIVVDRVCSRSALVAFETNRIQRPARLRRPAFDGPSARRGAAPADRDRDRDPGRDPPTRPGRRRADRPLKRASGRARAGRAGRVHDPDHVPAQAQPAARG